MDTENDDKDRWEVDEITQIQEGEHADNLSM